MKHHQTYSVDALNAMPIGTAAQSVKQSANAKPAQSQRVAAAAAASTATTAIDPDLAAASCLAPASRFHHSFSQIQDHAAAALRHAQLERSTKKSIHGPYTTLPSRARVLSIEGSDPIGGAGTMADMKAFTAHGVFGYAAMTCVCAQNTQGVTDIVNMEPDFLRKQLISVSSDGVIDSMKIGMLGTPEIVDCVRDWLTELLRTYKRRGLPRPWIVIDPVMYAKSGDSLLTPDAEQELRTILPMADIITPNVPELAALAGSSEMPRTWDDAVAMACTVAQDLGVRVYAKAGMFALEASENRPEPTGNFPGLDEPVDNRPRMCNDVLVEPGVADAGGTGAGAAGTAASARATSASAASARTASARATSTDATSASTASAKPRITTLYGPRVETVNVHGTGDSLSSSLAALRPRFLDWRETAQAAKDWMVGAIGGANDLHVGKGHGPIDFTWESAPTSQLFTDEYWAFLSVAHSKHRARITARESGNRASRENSATSEVVTAPLRTHYTIGLLDAYSRELGIAASLATSATDRTFFAGLAAEVGEQIRLNYCDIKSADDAADAGIAIHRNEKPLTPLASDDDTYDYYSDGESMDYYDDILQVDHARSLDVTVAALLPHLWVASLEFGNAIPADEAHELADATAQMAEIANREARGASNEDYNAMIEAARQITLREYNALEA
ncbi:MAG: bifunctional hydroxymethylpyrimidine kinase/phosphomethylpyrimidine kinase [Bifidobacteriaceae bacterium]|nr:bifunctional hydroxymethylpyrimidine kinase/phosphomethylpyrimidine kinase [Bifidobacteriaceae bacterium]